MNNIQSVGNVALKNKQVPEVETKSNNLYRVNFKADGDGYRYTQPAILQQQQQDQFLRQLEKQQKKEAAEAKKKEKELIEELRHQTDTKLKPYTMQKSL